MADRDDAVRELEKLARRRRPTPSPSPKPERAPPDREPTMPERVIEALASCVWFNSIWFLVALPVVAIALSFAVFGFDYGIFGGAPGLALGLGWIMGVQPRLARRAAMHERAWLESLPLSLNVTGYLAYLAQRHGGSTVVNVAAESEAPLDEEAQRLVLDAIHGVMPGSSAAFHGATLIVSSPPLDTTFEVGRVSTRKKDGNSAPIHAWVRRLLCRALLPTSRAYKLDRVAIRRAPLPPRS